MVKTDRRLEATSLQLLAEVASSPYRSVRALADAMNVDYSTLNRQVNGKATLRMERIFDILEVLEVPIADFFISVQHRLDGTRVTVLQRTA